ncbi:MAG: hypothetical protein QOJ51_2994 [Acidobacteriaceae bacterium]|jgi:hypothetical protein|nr:hypothetical protein [Acidobacteriaceae bacterium]
MQTIAFNQVVLAVGLCLLGTLASLATSRPHRWLVVTMSMPVAMTVIVILMAPVSFVVSPSFPIVVVMWM